MYFSWANLEKHLQWHEEQDNAPTEQLHAEPSNEQNQEFTPLRTKNLANLSASQLKLLKESFEQKESDSEKAAKSDEQQLQLKSELDRMEMSDSEGKMSESENWPTKNEHHN